uniref:Uncharacterized protein n=1 Tax=Ciona savignyi TaxID=51511 RepID=H2Z3E7_CIOSA
MEWLSEYVRTNRDLKLDEIFFSTVNGLQCKVCCEAKIGGEFSEGKILGDWKLDYLERHVKNIKVICERTLLKLYKDVRKERIKILINNIFLAIRMNASMLLVQKFTTTWQTKYVSMPQSWRSKNYAFEFICRFNK